MKYLLLLIFCSGCTPIMKVIYNFHDPQYETLASISRGAKKYGFPDSLITTMDSASWMAAMSKISIPDVRIYNSEGHFVRYAPPESCNAAAFGVLDSLCNYSSRSILRQAQYDPARSHGELVEPLSGATSSDSLQTLNTELAKFNYSTPRHDNPEWTVFITWAMFSGRLNKNHVKPWLESLQKQPCSVRVYLVNMDVPFKDCSISNKK